MRLVVPLEVAILISVVLGRQQHLGLQGLDGGQQIFDLLVDVRSQIVDLLLQRDVSFSQGSEGSCLVRRCAQPVARALELPEQPGTLTSFLQGLRRRRCPERQ